MNAPSWNSRGPLGGVLESPLLSCAVHTLGELVGRRRSGNGWLVVLRGDETTVVATLGNY